MTYCWIKKNCKGKIPIARMLWKFEGYRRKRHPTPVFFLENPMDGGAWWVTGHEVAKSQTRLSDFTFFFTFHYKIERNGSGEKHRK